MRVLTRSLVSCGFCYNGVEYLLLYVSLDGVVEWDSGVLGLEIAEKIVGGN
jgi:hypothetical protein